MKSVKIILSIVFMWFTVESTGQCDLPSELPSSLSELEIANRAIAECFAPKIHQMADAEVPISEGGKADLITSAFYDNSDFSDNWNNLPNFSIQELMPHVYYSVVWTDKTWIVTYGFYHPRDYSPTGLPVGNVCCADNHEHDFEGAFFVINREFGDIRLAGSISHHDVFIESSLYGTIPPDIFIDDRTHAVRLGMENDCIDEGEPPISGGPCDDCKKFFPGNHIVYSYNGGQQSLNVIEQIAIVNYEGEITPYNVLTGTGTYVLEDIFGLHANSFGSLRNNPNYFPNDKFFMSGNDPCEDAGLASAPWGWSQLTYAQDEILKLACVSSASFTGFAAYGSTVQIALNLYPPIDFCNDPLFYENESTVEHNPYFNATHSVCYSSPEEIDIIVSEDQTWNGLLLENQGDQFKSITIKNNSVLRIESFDMRMLISGKIIVESGSTLVLDHSIVRSCDDQERWSGIYLENGAAIEIINESLISQSRLGIYNNENLNNYLSSEGELDPLELYHLVSETAGNNVVTINNSYMEDNFISLLLDGNSNIIHINQDATINHSNYGLIMRGNESGSLNIEDSHFINNDRALFALSSGSNNFIFRNEFLTDQDILSQIELRNVDHLDFQMNEMDGPGHHLSAFESNVEIVNDNRFLNGKVAVWAAGSYPTAASARIGVFEAENGDDVEITSFLIMKTESK